MHRLEAALIRIGIYPVRGEHGNTWTLINHRTTIGLESALEWKTGSRGWISSGVSKRWLSNLRNAVVHRTATQKAVVTLDRQINFRESLRHEAKKAVAFALQVAFLPSREPAVNAV